MRLCAAVRAACTVPVHSRCVMRMTLTFEFELGEHKSDDVIDDDFDFERVRTSVLKLSDDTRTNYNIFHAHGSHVHSNARMRTLKHTLISKLPITRVVAEVANEVSREIFKTVIDGYSFCLFALLIWVPRFVLVSPLISFGLSIEVTTCSRPMDPANIRVKCLKLSSLLISRNV